MTDWFYLLVFIFRDGVKLRSPGWPGTHYVDLPGVCTITPSIAQTFAEHLLCAGHKAST